MLLKSIKLVNFRQFRNECVDFARGENQQNVTIIIGENGTGKTTFAQAFFWCLYGETEFNDKNVLNKIVATEMVPGKDEKVKVVLCLRHGELDYTLTREQNYKKDYSNNIKADNTVFDIQYKDSTGNTQFVKRSQCEAEIKGILPKELSHYFFFDGERIEKMSKEISTGKKATDFAEAVKGLLGLNGMLSAMNHLNPRTRLSVIGSYNQSFNSSSNQKIEEYSEIIEKCSDELSKIDKDLDNLESQKTTAEARKKEKENELKQYEEGKKFQDERDKLEKDIRTILATQASVYKSICNDFNASMNNFVSISLVKRAVELINQKDVSGKDIPYMHQKTIEYLLSRKLCICGTHLDEGTVAYEKVKELIDYLPPKSLSTTISDFNKVAGRRASSMIDLLDRTKQNLAVISSQNDEISEKENELHNIESKISGEDIQAKVKTIYSEIKLCEDTINKSKKTYDDLLRKQGALESQRERAYTERQSLTLVDKTNKLTQIYLMYANRIYDEIANSYEEKEKEIRNCLQNTINDIFKQIYDGGLSLTIDEKYHISVQVNDYEGDVETSTGQSIAVIFAFIAGIIKLARDNRHNNNEETKLLSSEPYPLVMDAPLSTFDKKRIATACTALPSVAEQVIIFIKDTDGDLAEKYLGNRIGSRHVFEKKNEFETILK